METTGFWIVISGSILLILSNMSCNEKWDCCMEKLHVPRLMQMFAPMIAIVMIMVGGHVWCLGNQGRYPGYPLDIIIEWLR